jgi:hypothetical protein
VSSQNAVIGPSLVLSMDIRLATRMNLTAIQRLIRGCAATSGCSRYHHSPTGHMLSSLAGRRPFLCVSDCWRPIGALEYIGKTFWVDCSPAIISWEICGSSTHKLLIAI